MPGYGLHASRWSRLRLLIPPATGLGPAEGPSRALRFARPDEENRPLPGVRGAQVPSARRPGAVTRAASDKDALGRCWRVANIALPWTPPCPGCHARRRRQLAEPPRLTPRTSPRRHRRRPHARALPTTKTERVRNPVVQASSDAPVPRTEAAPRPRAPRPHRFSARAHQPIPFPSNPSPSPAD